MRSFSSIPPRASPRYPIEIVRRLSPPAPARVGGRVVDEADGAIEVQDVTGSLWARVAKPAPAPGCWVRVEGTWNGERLAEAKCELLSVPRVLFPPKDGEWLWLQSDGGRRARLLQKRGAILRAIREFFHRRAFIEVQTPVVVPSPGLEVHLDAFEVKGGEQPAWLITSPEYQMKRMLAGGMQRIYQMGPCFRRGELGGLHQPEFTMLEWYRAFAGQAEIVRDTEQLVAHVAAEMHDGAMVIRARRGEALDVTPPWRQMTVAEAFERHAGVDVTTLVEDEEAFFRTLVTKVEPVLGRDRPTWLTAWPAKMASLARLSPEDPSVAERVECYVGGVELSNGFGELIDPVEQRTRLESDARRRSERGLPAYPVDERFVGALEEGLPPCGGNALGVDRLVMLMLGVDRIDDVLAIPHGRL